jgi:DNA-binding MarR family transcriptional regulator
VKVPLRSSPRRRRAVAARDATRLPLWSRPGYLVRRLNQIHYALFAEECREFGVTPVQYGLLTALFIRGELDQVSLAEELGIDRTNVAEVLKRLAVRGLVRRQPNPADRRARLAALTPRGQKLTGGMYAAMQRAQDRFLAPLTPVERDAFMAMLVRLIDANNAYGRAMMRID